MTGAGKWALLLVAVNVQAGPLREPAQCRIFWQNIERVTSWTAETKNNLYWQCLQRALDWRRASRMSVQESVELRNAWALTPAPDMGESEDENGMENE